MADNTDSGADASADGLGGRLIGERHRVEEVVSTGANTIITNAVDEQTGAPVTLKVVQPDLASSDEFRQAFRRHAEVATALTHPNIASVLDWGEVELGDESTVFWVVEYLGGGSLRDLFDRGRLLEPSQALVVGLEACRALDVAHQRGIVHTELTPSKMVFGDDRRLRIVDFGFARLLGGPAWEDPATVPTHVARYASPEQALGVEVDSKTDVYALTLSLIESLTGSVPFAGDSTVATLAGRVDKLMPVSADMGSLASVLERAGRPEADDRSSAAEFGRALVQAAEKLPRPEPIPIVTAGLFAPANMRRPSDPTGGIERTPDDDTAADPGAEDDGGANAAGVAAAAGVVAGAAAVGAVASPGAPEVSDADAPADGAPEVSGAPADDAPEVSDTDAAASENDVELPETVAIDAVDTAVADESDVELPETVAIDAVDTEASADEADAELPETVAIDAVDTEAPTETPADAAAAATADDEPEPESLVLVTGLADPPSGAVEVGATEVAAGAAGATAVATEAAPAVEPTAQMPVAPPPVGDPPAQVYDEERPRRRIGTIVLLIVFVIAGIAALSYAGWVLLRTKSFDVPDLAGVNEDVALNEISGNDWLVTIERERNDAEPTVGNVIRTLPGPGVSLEEGEAFLMVVSDGPEFRTLPELAELAVADAEQALRDLRLQPVVSARAFSETVPLDDVISWEVQGDATAVAGVQVLPDTVVLLTVSDGPEPRSAPSLPGLTVEQAQAEIDALQLTLVLGEDVFSDVVPPGLIVAQVPDPGVAVERGGSVEIRVSKGPDVIALPDLTGLAYADAEQLLLDTGFVIGNLLGTTEGTFVSLTIGGESVEVGTIWPRGTAVDVIFL